MPDASPAPDSANRQWPLAVLGAVALGMLAYRGYGPRFAPRPTDDLPPAVAKVDLNAAERAELLQIPGVGGNLADAILSHRASRGRFESVDELDDLPGVGGKTVDKLRGWLTVGPVARGQAPDAVETLERKPSAQPAGKVTAGDPPLNVNTATADELQRLPAIGAKLAERILAERAKKPFASADDLRRVSGIGAKTVEKLRPLVRFE